VRAITSPYDALVMPTVPVQPPRVNDVEPDEGYRRINMLVLRNPSIANFVDGCSISVPCHRAGDAPVGLMLFGAHGSDRRLLSIAAAVEKVISPTEQLRSGL
jgi:aspartyl-tRNA(Asn)/glutamyl-tRNA(Gln) amidotransferase subunit A